MTVRATRVALASVLLLPLLTVPAAAQEPETRVAVTLSEAGCEPAAITVPAGVVVFEITNAGGDVGEFEILSVDRVVDEVENILPGFVQNITTRLDGGDYLTICYTKQSPQGTLSVTGGPAPSRPPNAVVDEAVIAEYQQAYQAWVNERAGVLVAEVEAFVSSITAGDLVAARAAYPRVRIPWEQIEPVAESFADLDAAMDWREEAFPLGVDDPAFTGFHRIERLLFTEGASGDLNALATQLVQNARDLQGRLGEMSIDPRLMARGAGELIDEVAQSKLTGEEDRYSGTDLWSIRANVDGSKKIVDLFRPTLATVAADALARIDAAFAAVDEVMARYADGDGFQPFSAISPEDLTQLQARMAGLTETLSALPGLLGLEA